MRKFLTDAGFSPEFIEEAIDLCTSGDETDMVFPAVELREMFEEDRIHFGLAPFIVKPELVQAA